MKVIGLCGGSGSGKGVVCSLFASLGIKSIDADKVYHDIISTDSECTKELISYFGNGIHANPGIDRSALRSAAFSSAEALTVLNEITHKHIIARIRTMIADMAQNGAEGIILDAPLLFESGLDRECELTVCVIANTNTRIQRIIKRDGITLEQARARIASQIPNEELTKKCTYTVINDSDTESLRAKIIALKKQIFDN